MRTCLLLIALGLLGFSCKGEKVGLEPEEFCEGQRKAGRTLGPLCVSNAQSTRKEEPKIYACQSACIQTSSSLDKLDPCMELCRKAAEQR